VVLAISNLTTCTRAIAIRTSERLGRSNCPFYVAPMPLLCRSYVPFMSLLCPSCVPLMSLLCPASYANYPSRMHNGTSFERTSER
jgi:hypothetical protein